MRSQPLHQPHDDTDAANTARLADFIYGLDDGPYEWLLELHAVLIALGARRLDSDLTIYVVPKPGAENKPLELRTSRDAIHGIIGLGGTQGTPNCTAVMRSLPYGFPKVMVSTIASGDVGSFVDIKDITMMFSVGDILGLNPLTRRILANAAGAAHGMALASARLEDAPGDRKVIGMTKLGILL